VRSVVAHGVTEDAFDVLDPGRSRNAADVLDPGQFAQRRRRAGHQPPNGVTDAFAVALATS